MVGLSGQDPRATTLTRLWLEKHAREAQRRYHELTGRSVRVVTQYPANLAEFRTEIQRLADSCARIEALGIMSHGNVGYLQIGRDGVSERNIEDAFGRGLGCAISANATVEISGCNVGRGHRGADFMLAAATRLLPKGGTLFAPQYYVYGNAFLGLAPQSIFGDRELQVDAGATHPRWIKGGEPCPRCALR